MYFKKEERLHKITHYYKQCDGHTVHVGGNDLINILNVPDIEDYMFPRVLTPVSKEEFEAVAHQVLSTITELALTINLVR